MSISVCRVDPRLLVKALHMPDGTVIDNAQWDVVTDRLWLRVQHQDILPQREGYPFQGAHLMVTEHVDITSPDRVARTYKGKWQ